MSEKSLTIPDSTCYVCGELTFLDQRQTFTSVINKFYLDYFGSSVRHQDIS